jgi:Protein of unknown function (DUF3987)
LPGAADSGGRVKTPEPLGRAALSGIVGEFVDLVEPHTEADAAGIVAHFIAEVGNVVGRHAYVDVSGQRHYTNLCCAVVGETSTGRKGTALAAVNHGLKELDPNWNIVQGLSTGEGLIAHVRDPRYADVLDKKTQETHRVCVDLGITDKRLCVVETEAGSFLKRMGGEGNSLSAVMRQVWDSGKLQTLTKNLPLSATDAHVTIIIHITPSELLSLVSAVDAFNGLLNRFLWFAVNSEKMLPEGGNLPDVDFAEIRNHIRQIRDLCAAGKISRMTRDEDAKWLWAKVYPALRAQSGGIQGSIASRATAQVLRLSTIYALLDLSPIVKAKHLEAALDVWRYCSDSIGCIFGGANDPANRKYVEFIETSGGTVAVKEFHRRWYRDFPTAPEARAKLVELAKANIGIFGFFPQGRKGGKPVEFFKLSVDDTPAGDAENASSLQSTPHHERDISDPEWTRGPITPEVIEELKKPWTFPPTPQQLKEKNASTTTSAT